MVNRLDTEDDVRVEDGSTSSARQHISAHGRRLRHLGLNRVQLRLDFSRSAIPSEPSGLIGV